MNALFSEPTNTRERPVTGAVKLLPTPKLPVEELGYAAPGRSRVPADPVGLNGLPVTRYGINVMLLDLCDRLISAAGKMVRGKRLAAELELTGTRALRLLVAYGHVHHRLRQIVGVPGDGYVWGPARPEVYATMAGHSRRMGRCWFFNSALYGKQAPAVEAAQMLLDFVGAAPAAGATAPNDQLSVMMTAEGVSVEKVLSAIMDRLTQTESGREALAVVGRRHADVLVPESMLTEMVKTLDTMRGKLLGLGKKVG